MIKVTPVQEHDALLSAALRYEEEGNTERAHDARSEAYNIACREGWTGPEGDVQ